MRFSWLVSFLLICCLSTSIFAAKSDCQLTFASPELKPHFWLEKGIAKGIAVDYFRLIEKRTQCRFDFVVKPWKRVQHEMKMGKVDATIGYYNKARTAFAYFPDYHFQRQSLFLFSRSDNLESYSIEKLQQQNKPLLYLQHWYLGELSHILEKKPKLSLPTPDPLTGLQQLLQGKAEALLAPKVNTLYNISQADLKAKIKISSAAQATFFQYAFFSKRSVSAQQFSILNEAIADISISGSVEKIILAYTR